MKIAVITSSLGGFDNVEPHVEQSLPFDYYLFTDENFPPRDKVMLPRLQAKIPKCFAWQMVPNYDYYLWIDGNLTLKHEDSLKYFLDNIKGYDLVTLKHPLRRNILQELNHIEKRVRMHSNYLASRYSNELFAEQYDVIKKDKDYVDDLLLIGGLFLYRNTPKVQKALKEWWYHISRFHICDQYSFVYTMRKANLKINALSDDYSNCWFLKTGNHRFRNK